LDEITSLLQVWLLATECAVTLLLTVGRSVLALGPLQDSWPQFGYTQDSCGFVMGCPPCQAYGCLVTGHIPCLCQVYTLIRFCFYIFLTFSSIILYTGSSLGLLGCGAM